MLQVFLDRMIGPLRCHCQDSRTHFRWGIQAVHLIQIHRQSRIIRIIPSLFHLFPWQFPSGVNAIPVLIERHTLQMFVMPKDQHIVSDVLHYFSVLVDIQMLLPVCIIKLGAGCLQSLPAKGFPDILILGGKFLHSLKRRKFCGESILICLSIQFAKLVQAHHIKSVHQLSAGRVRGMVAVSKFPFIQYDSRLGVCRNVIITPRHSAMLIYVWKERINRIFDSVGPAECAHQTRLFQRICLLFNLPLHYLFLSFRHRPFRRVAPIFVSGKHSIRIEQTAFDFPIDKLPICRGGRPVHEAARLIGGIVKHLNPYILSDFPGYCHILIRCHFTGERDDQTEPWLLWCAFMGGIQITLEREEHLQLLRNIRSRIIHIQGKR